MLTPPTYRIEETVMATTPQSQARAWLRWIARHWSAARIAATHRERVAAGVRAALALDEERGADWSGVTVR